MLNPRVLAAQCQSDECGIRCRNSNFSVVNESLWLVDAGQLENDQKRQFQVSDGPPESSTLR